MVLTVPYVGYAYLLVADPLLWLLTIGSAVVLLVASTASRRRERRGRRPVARPAGVHAGANCDYPTPAWAQGPMLASMAHQVLVVEDEEDVAFPSSARWSVRATTSPWVDSGQKALDSLPAGPEVVIPRPRPARTSTGLRCRRAREAGFEGAIMIVT